jgi:hypothetical protein
MYVQLPVRKSMMSKSWDALCSDIIVSSQGDAGIISRSTDLSLIDSRTALAIIASSTHDCLYLHAVSKSRPNRSRKNRITLC